MTNYKTKNRFTVISIYYIVDCYSPFIIEMKMLKAVVLFLLLNCSLTLIKHEISQDDQDGTTKALDSNEETTTVYPDLVDLNSTRIVGGWPAKRGQIPFQVALLLYKDFQFCAGTLISPLHVLTAGHCTNGMYAEQISVRVGSLYRDKGGVIIQVKEIRQHPDFVLETKDFDVSVLVLQQPVTFSRDVGTVMLPSAGAGPIEGTKLIVSGWGTTSYHGSISPILRYVDVTVGDRDYCRYIFPTLTLRHFCAGGEEGKDSCQGDSGGPIIYADSKIQAGIVSKGKKCAVKDIPAAYTNLAELVDWVHQQIAETT